MAPLGALGPRGPCCGSHTEAGVVRHPRSVKGEWAPTGKGDEHIERACLGACAWIWGRTPKFGESGAAALEAGEGDAGAKSCPEFISLGTKGSPRAFGP